jgi:hypothetical protein
MNTDYRNSVPSPFRATRNEKVPVLEEVTRSIGTYNLTATVAVDTEALSIFKHVPGLIAFICTLKKGNDVIGIGRGTATLNRMSKYVDRAVCYAFNASLIDAMVRSTKTLDAIYLKSMTQDEAVAATREPIPNTPTFSTDETEKYATDKQKVFLTRLINKNCKGSTKEEYLSQLNSPYLSKFNCSEMINSLITK